jgi:glycosyltransferase involved in cell wall biosynthesis
MDLSEISSELIVDEKAVRSRSNVVSVIIPCFNRSEFLRECLESIARQTYPFIETIVVDDASTEDLKSVITNIGWSGTHSVKYYRLDENRGPGHAREIGRLHATGAYINYLDSDDLLHPDKISLQVEMLGNHPEAGMCYCMTHNFSALPFNGTEKLRGSHYIEKILPGLLEKRPWTTSACLWSRTATDAIGAWFDGRIREDTLYEVRAGCKDIPIVFVPQILSYCRIHSGEPVERAPGIKKYQYAIATYHEMLRELESSGKLEDARVLHAMTREIFRVCRKLFDYKELETAYGILKHLVIIKQSRSGNVGTYYFYAKLILFFTDFFPKKYQAVLFSKLCTWAMADGNLPR